jgi:hypothetical protein
MPDTLEITSEKSISFSDIVKTNDSYVKVTEDGLLHAADMVHVMTGKKGKRMRRVLRNLKEDIPWHRMASKPLA